MEKKLLWFLVVALLAVDITMLVQRRGLSGELRELEGRSRGAVLESRYADEEQRLLLGIRSVPASFPVLANENGVDQTAAVELFLVVSVEDCTNCIEDEVAKLNEIAERAPTRVAGISGFFIDDDRPEVANRFLAHLAPSPRFPFSVRNVLSDFPDATTPLVLVVGTRDRKIVDVHKPIPENLAKRDAFYSRLGAALELRI